VLKYKLAVVHLILNIIVVDINVFSALIVALTCNKLEGGLVVTIELYRIDVFTYVTNLLEELLKLYSFFCSVRKANVLSFSS
jgi:ABC-type transporter Mla maintaining outer membrane lipid asymmetry permease subunit MlaE